jgi:hypothetical protein
MIPDLRTHRCPGRAATAAGRSRLVLILLILAVALSASCDKTPLYAPTGTTITLTVNTQSLPINGTAQITASVLESGGYAVQNGTMVTFTTTLGTVIPSEVGTTNGKATVVFNAGTVSGTAVINAYSGANSTSGSTSTGTGGTTTSTGSGVSIVIGAAAANTLVLTASPSSLSQLGGSSIITATVYDTNNNALSGVLVAFSTDQGSLSPVSAVTNGSGQAQTILTTTQAATVTGTVGAKTGTVKVASNAVPVVTITGPTATPTVGVSANFTLTVAAGSGAAPIRTVGVTFGDGLSTSLGAATGTITVPHVYLLAGQFTVTATATDSIGQSTAAAVPVTVFPAVPFTVTVNPSTLTAQINVTNVSFTATPNAGAPTVTQYNWDFGDGKTQSSKDQPVIAHIYEVVPNGQPTQQVLVTVTATGSDGRVGYGSCIITVTR